LRRKSKTERRRRSWRQEIHVDYLAVFEEWETCAGGNYPKGKEFEFKTVENVHFILNRKKFYCAAFQPLTRVRLFGQRRHWERRVYVEVHRTGNEVGFHASFGHFQDDGFVGDDFIFKWIGRSPRWISSEYID
jgi:hypothetical protein